MSSTILRLTWLLGLIVAIMPDAALADDSPSATIKGRVTDRSTGEGLPAATIVVKSASGNQSLATEIDGSFTLTLPAGAYTLELATPEYIGESRTITLTGSQALQLDVTLAPMPAKADEETIEVYSTIDTHKSSAVLAERRAAATVSDAISAEQIQRSPDSNASEAAKRVVSATIEDNRYVVIRGLGGRYSLTLLNGTMLPSPDPDVPAAPLDLFPSAMITNLTVHKTFSPDMPANFAGGALTIETRSYPTKLTFKARLGFASDSNSSFRSVNGYEGGSLDLLGYDDGTRALPSSIPSNKLAGDSSLPPEQRAQQASAFPDIWTLRHKVAGPNLNVGATLGDTFVIDDQRVGYYASFNYGHGYTRRTTHIARVGESDGNGGYLPSVLQLEDVQGTEQATLGGLVAAGWKPSSSHQVDVFSLYAHTADISGSQVTGIDNSTAVLDRTRLRFVERELMFGQLLGEDRLADRKAILQWQANVAHVAQHEPDTRDLLRTQTPDGRYAIDRGSGSAERLFAELGDTTGGAGADLSIPRETFKLKFGTTLGHSARSYQARRFHFDISGDSAFLSPEQAFDPHNAGVGMSMYESTLPTDGYGATRTIAAGYAMADVTPVDKLRVVAGARLEQSSLDVGLDSAIDLMVPPAKHTQRTDRDILPAINIVYAATPSSNLRAAYAMTVARPNFREIAPALYYDYVRRRAIGGNPNLLETRIHNADLRWETFFGETEVLAASVFAKQFRDPIEQTVEDAGDGQNVGFANAASATSYGLELEGRMSLGRAFAALAPLTLGANLALIGSRIDVMGATRSLQGQSPYVANIDLGYEAARSGTRVDLLYNVFGRRIEEVGTAGAGNVYEEPFHRLDLAFSQRLLPRVRFKLAGSNLFDQRVVRTQNDVEILGYQVGVTVVGSVEFGLD